MNTLLFVAAAMTAGLLFTRVVKLVHLPDVTGYLIAGLLIGPHILGLVTAEGAQSLGIITTVALGFIAFSIGAEFKLSSIKSIGGSVIVITVCQAMCAVIFVDIALCLAGVDTAMALTLGAIATATAPAATLMVVRQYRAKGVLTNTLLPVVAMDDAIGLMVYSVSISIAQMLALGAGFSFVGTVVKPIGEILLSLATGGVLGLAVALSNRFFHSRANRLNICIAAVVLGVGLAKLWGLSDLLLCMSIGAVYVNLRDDALKTLENTDSWTPPLFMLFFVLSGAELDITVLPTVGLIGVIYIVVRALGKYTGAYLGAAAVKAPESVRKYLGITLMPQAGVAIGMAQLALTQLPRYGAKIQAVVLCATLIYELVGPVCTKLSLMKAGEIEPEGKKSGA